MRHGASGRRSRNRSGGGRNRGGSQNRSQVFDSNGPDVRIRGTAYQILEKYTALARDANGSGDYILAESYLQHAEHYQRIINGWQEDGQERRHHQANNSDESFEGETDDLALPTSIIGKNNERAQSARKEELQDA